MRPSKMGHFEKKGHLGIDQLENESLRKKTNLQNAF